MNNSNTLSGWQIVIMRPPHQAQSLMELITKHGGQAISLPMIEIHPIPLTPPQLTDYGQAIAQADMLIALSANAIYCAPQVLLQQMGLRSELQVIAIGKATAKALQEKNIAVAYVADGKPSEELLAHSFLATPRIHNKRIVLLAGKEGRTLLATTLQDRGANVLPLFVYRQQCPDIDLSSYFQAWQQKLQPICFVATSGNILANLLKLTPDTALPWLKHQPLLVISERIAQLATEYGFKQIFIAPDPYPEILLSTLLNQVKICHTISSL